MLHLWVGSQGVVRLIQRRLLDSVTTLDARHHYNVRSSMVVWVRWVVCARDW